MIETTPPKVLDNVLTLTGERKVENEETKNEFRRIERSYCRFTRSFTLPNELESDKVEAKYGDRVLTVTIPKAEKTKPRKIEIS
jgi:HSP20 family protein